MILIDERGKIQTYRRSRGRNGKVAKMKYYVTADIHGYHTYFKEALEEVGFFEEKEPHKLILCGDLLDRGGEGTDAVDFMLDLAQKDQLIYILGNHEDLLVQCMEQVASGNVYEIASGLSHHSLNGTWDTLLQIGGMEELEAYKNPTELLRRVMNSPFYQKLLPLGIDYYETPNYIFTHGWIPCISKGYRPRVRCSYDPNWRGADVNAWKRARWSNGIELACEKGILEPNKTVVCGHWHTSYGHSKLEQKGSERGEDADYSPFYANGIIALDACVAASKKVNCIVIED